MNLSYLLNVERPATISRCSIQAFEETLLALGDDLDEHVLDNLYEQQVKKVYIHQACDAIVSARHGSEKGAENLPKIEDYNDLEQQQQQTLMPQERAIKRQSSSSTLQAKSVDLG